MKIRARRPQRLQPNALLQTVAAALALWLAPAALAQPAPPALEFSSPAMQARLGAPYHAALDNLLRINTVPIPAPTQKENYGQSGLLSRAPRRFVRAGGGYTQPWTRDASINSWSAASLLEPAVARNTLWAVIKREPAQRDSQQTGGLIVQQDNQWWDQSIWVIAAWNHYLVTGDRAFLANAYPTAVHTLARDKQKHYNAERGLYQGPAFLNDGIAGYPAPPADATDSLGGFVLSYAGASQLMVLSTNCIYAEAYRSLARMAQALGKPPGNSNAPDWDTQADALAETIRKTFWLPNEGRFGYLLHADGTLDPSQEGSGMAFAILFHIATPEQAAAMTRSAHISPHGMEDVSPAFARYDAEHPGRHNNILWPPIAAFWGQASAQTGDAPGFAREMEDLAGLATASHNRFWEIYNAQTGLPNGGWQGEHLWYSQPDQTWSATGYLRLVYDGLFGMHFGEDGLHFAPTLPEGWGPVTLTGLHYRHATLTIKLTGSGQKVVSVTLDGKTQPTAEIPATLNGQHTMKMDLAN